LPETVGDWVPGERRLYQSDRLTIEPGKCCEIALRAFRGRSRASDEQHRQLALVCADSSMQQPQLALQRMLAAMR